MLPYPNTLINTNGIRLNVITAGDPQAKAVILLHGFPEFSYGWRKQIPALIKAGYFVIVPDQRGYNLSDKPRGVRVYALPELGKDVLGLMDHFGIQQANLIGHDWGAVVAWSVALTWPERVARLGILNVPHPVVMLKYLSSSLQQLRKSWYIGFFQIPWLADWMMQRDNFHLAARMLIGSGKKSTFTRADLETYRQAWSQPGALTAMINWYRAMVWHRPPTPADIRLHIPVLIQWGKQDVAFNYEMAEDSIKLCDAGHLIFYDNATHWVQHDEAEAVNNELLLFLKN